MSLFDEIREDHAARINTLKRSALALARAHDGFPSEITRQDIALIEHMIKELGGDTRNSAHTELMQRKESRDD